jgi:hypothetical protein
LDSSRSLRFDDAAACSSSPTGRAYGKYLWSTRAEGFEAKGTPYSMLAMYNVFYRQMCWFALGNAPSLVGLVRGGDHPNEAGRGCA